MQAMHIGESMELASYGDVLFHTVNAKRKARLAHRIESGRLTRRERKDLVDIQRVGVSS